MSQGVCVEIIFNGIFSRLFSTRNALRAVAPAIAPIADIIPVKIPKSKEHLQRPKHNLKMLKTLGIRPPKNKVVWIL